MRFFHIHPDDARWLRRWLRNNLLCVSAILGFLFLIRSDSRAPVAPMNRAIAAPLSADASRPVAVAPTGWRRTSQGWEHVSTWRAPAPPLAEIIRQQELREPAWMQAALAQVRSVPPLLFAVLQIAAIAVIVRVANKYDQVVDRPAPV